MVDEKYIPLVRAIRDDPLIRVAAETADALGFPLFLVGGWIRDRLLGRPSQDYDFILDGHAQAFAEALSERLRAAWFRLGREEEPNYRIVGSAFTMDVVAQHPDGLERELWRRDFTMNTLTFSFGDDRVLDPLGGYEDIGKKAIRIVAPDVLQADPLRMLRAVRFTAVLEGFRLSDETGSEIRQRVGRLSESAAERIREEIDRIMLSGRASRSVSLLEEIGMLSLLLPEVSSLSGLDQGPYHHLDALGHTLQTLEQVDSLEDLKGVFDYAFSLDEEDRIVLAYAALLHDVGKRETRSVDSAGIPHFYGHEKNGVLQAGEAMKRLCFANRRADRVAKLIRYHVLGLGLIKAGYTARALRRIVRRLGDELPLHVLLSLADRRSARGRDYAGMEQKTIALGQALLDLFRGEGEGILNPPILVTGSDVMEILGIGAGPAVGEVLRKVRTLQMDREIGSREEAVAFLERLGGEGES